MLSPRGAGPGSPRSLQASRSPGGHPSPLPGPQCGPDPAASGGRSHSGTGCPRCLPECPQAGPAPSSPVPVSSRPLGHLLLEGFLEQVTRAEQSRGAGLPAQLCHSTPWAVRRPCFRPLLGEARVGYGEGGGHTGTCGQMCSRAHLCMLTCVHVRTRVCGSFGPFEVTAVFQHPLVQRGMSVSPPPSHPAGGLRGPSLSLCAQAFRHPWTEMGGGPWQPGPAPGRGSGSVGTLGSKVGRGTGATLPWAGLN